MKRLTIALALVALASGTARAQTAAQWNATGKTALDSGKNDDAVKAFEKAVKLEDANSSYHMNLAQALGEVARKSNFLKQGMMAHRIKNEMERARELDPKSLDPHQGLMQFYMEAPSVMGGGMAKARAEATEISKLSRVQGHFAMVTIAQHDKDTVAIEREYRAAYADDPDSVSVYANLAAFLINKKRSAEGFGVLEQVLARHPNEPMALFYIGRFAGASGEQLDRGEQAMRKYIALPANPSDKTRAAPATAHFRLGELLVKKGNKADAKKEFELALQLNPKLDGAKNALKSLQ